MGLSSGMKPTSTKCSRRLFLRCSLLAPAVALFAGGGCAAPWMNRNDDLETALTGETSETSYVGQFSSPWGFNGAKAEGIGLVTMLGGTGGNPRPSPQREHLIGEMQSHDVHKPYELLRSPDTAMVLVRGYLPPGIQKGESFDIEVRIPPKSDTTSLKSGTLMRTRLRPMELLGSGVRTGHTIGVARGSLLIDSTFKGEQDGMLETRARILGGGVALKSRPLGLSIRSGANVMVSTRIATSINGRFDTLVRGVRQQVATAHNDRRIDLETPRQYKHNLSRYMRVVANIAIGESSTDRFERLKLLERQMQDPTTAAVAALRLEALGEVGIPTLQGAIQSSDPEVRFYAAEALAYLGKEEAADPLTESAKNKPALRWRALAALTSLEDVSGGEALNRLMHVTSAETRYGAFRALQTRSPNDPLTRGEVLGGEFSYHTISTVGPPMVCFSSSRRAEIVLFGIDQRLSSGTLYSPLGWIIKAEGQDQIKVSRFSVRGNQFETVSTRLDDVIRAIAKVGGGYTDVLDFVETARREKFLTSRVVINPLPSPRRRYVRDDSPGSEVAESSVRPIGPIPELFQTHQGEREEIAEEKVFINGADDISEEPDESNGGFLGRLRGWFF